MKRPLLCVPALLVLLPACRTAAPAAAPGGAAGPDPLRAYVGELRLLRHDAAKANLRLDAEAPISAGCAVAVRVGAAAFSKGSARFSLQTLGTPRLNGRAADCKRMQPAVELVVSGFAPLSKPSELTAALERLLQTPEAYLKSNGVAFDLAPGTLTGEVVCQEVFANAAERSLARKVTAWPLPLLSVDPWYRGSSRRLRQQGEIELEAIVGGDGRLHRPRLKTGLSDVHADAVLGPLPLWRFAPARRADGPVAARVALRPVLHIY